MAKHVAARRTSNPSTTTAPYHKNTSRVIQGVQLKSGQYLNMSNLFTKIYYMLYYTTNLYLQ